MKQIRICNQLYYFIRIERNFNYYNFNINFSFKKILEFYYLKDSLSISKISKDNKIQFCQYF